MRILPRLMLPLVLVVSSCGGDSGDDSHVVIDPKPGITPAQTKSSVEEVYAAMQPLCGEIAFARGVTSNETPQDDFGYLLNFWQTPEDRPAPFSSIYDEDGWSPVLLKTAQIGGVYNYNVFSYKVSSSEAAELCDTAQSLLFTTGTGPGDKQAYANLLFYITDFSTPATPWDGTASSESRPAKIDALLNYTTAISEFVDNGITLWSDAEFQYLPMRISCDQPFLVKESLVTIPLLMIAPSISHKTFVSLNKIISTAILIAVCS